RRRFLAAGPAEPIDIDPPVPEGATLGGGYVRYSDDNSNPRSLAQQLRNVLERAARDRAFVPWGLVFADAAVSGTTARRRGYELAKEAVQRDGGPATLYVDELGRAARDAIETLRLGRLITRLRRRLVGASDGFDSDTPHAQMMLAIFAMLHEWFSEQLRGKVNRGMRDAFHRGRNVRPPSFGYRLVPAFDSEGRPLLDRDGSPLKAKVIDPDEAVRVEEAFRLYAERGRGPERIARRFNERNVGGRRSWDRGSILQLLARTTYVGVEYEGQTRQVRDPETGKVTVERRPRAEWRRRDVPHLRIVPDALFERAAELMRERSDAYAEIAAKRKRSRTAAYPKVLVRPVCACGAELTLGRSSERYASFCCPNGSKGKHGCTLKTYKSVSIVTEAILNWVKENLFTEAFVDVAVRSANAALAEEAARPREDVRPIVREIKELQAKRDRLARIIDEHPGGDLGALLRRLQGHERTLKVLRRRLKAAKAAIAPLPEPFTKGQVEAELGDAAGLLADEVGVAAPVLAALTGPVTVREGGRTGRKGTPWVASF
ncbi:MAG TPA: recombinase family protein, partial [Planctomycetaceae bacterium]